MVFINFNTEEVQWTMTRRKNTVIKTLSLCSGLLSQTSTPTARPMLVSMKLMSLTLHLALQWSLHAQRPLARNKRAFWGEVTVPSLAIINETFIGINYGHKRDQQTSFSTWRLYITGINEKDTNQIPGRDGGFFKKTTYWAFVITREPEYTHAHVCDCWACVVMTNDNAHNVTHKHLE